MNTITAIDTVYKGYRFRSRLEARWALFFDLVDLRWEYETEPLSVNGEAYLPDFRIYPYQNRDAAVYLEVKPNKGGTTPTWPRVYLAGKCSEEHEWRGEAAGKGEDINWPDWRSSEHFTTMEGVSFLKCGPFPGDFHGMRNNTPHARDEGTENILNQCRWAIRRATMICAHLSTNDAFGTLTELGFAAALDTPISLTITENLVINQQYAGELPIIQRGNAWYPTHDLWFVEQLVGSSKQNSVAYVRSEAEARAYHAVFIQQNVAREIRLITGLAARHGAVAIVFGDPLDVARSSSALCNGFDLPVFVMASMNQAEAARAHRFDRH
jgi:hypothetical protein